MPTPPPAAAHDIALYEARQKIYPRAVDGRFARWRWALVFLTQAVFYGLPWLEWGQRQMVLFDLGARRFYLFGLVLYPQDFIYLTGLLVISALSLFLFTAVAGLLRAHPAARRRAAGAAGREQVCKYMCPYARFQSAMFDKDTLIVTYDAGRGEARGPRGKKADPKALGLGDCIDCALCVQVCPTGIDIRNGLQYECIGCGQCVDACNSVMDKVAYPRGLIRYATQNAAAQGWSQRQMLRRVARPRVLAYGAVLLALSTALLLSLATRTPLKVDVVRDRAALARTVAAGQLENVYRLQIMNATERPARYRIAAHGLEGLQVASEPEVEAGPAESRWVPVQLRAPYGAAPPGSHAVHFEVQALDGGARVSEKSVFLVPR